jgi:hypothetical protein
MVHKRKENMYYIIICLADNTSLPIVAKDDTNAIEIFQKATRNNRSAFELRNEQNEVVHAKESDETPYYKNLS